MLAEQLKKSILQAAIQGKLTDQRKEDGNAQDLYNQIQEEKQRLIKEKKIKKEKPLPEITADEVPFDIPKNWMWVRLGNLTRKIGAGNTPKGGKTSGVYKESGVEFIREMNVYNDGLHYDGMVYISNELAKTRTGSAVVAGDILLNITSGTDEITMDEMSQITSHIIRKVGNNAAVIWGVGTDPDLGDAVSVTIIATGFPTGDIELFGEENTCAGYAKQPECLKEEEVRVKPGLTEEQVRELETVPAFERRDLRVS